MCRNKILSLLTFAGLLFVQAAGASEVSPEELERWFNSNSFEPPRYTESGPSGEQLIFLKSIPEQAVHHHQNFLRIVPQSLKDGWVQMEQCHDNMDVISKAQVVFNKDRVRDLKVKTTHNIGKAWVEGNTVQMQDVKRGARMCLLAWTRALRVNDDGSFTLHNGPFMRRFLDGYFPLHVTSRIQFAGTGLKPLSVSPGEQEGFSVSQNGNSLTYEAWFEGKLWTRVHFSADIL